MKCLEMLTRGHKTPHWMFTIAQELNCLIVYRLKASHYDTCWVYFESQKQESS